MDDMHLSKTGRFSVIQAGVVPKGATEWKASSPSFVATPSVASSVAGKPPTMAEAKEQPKTEDMDVDALAAAVTKKQSEIKALKKGGAPNPEKIESLTKELQKLRLQLAAGQKAAGPEATDFRRKDFDDTMIRKMYVVPAFEIHGGVKGLFDLGPPSCALKANILDTWRKHFILNENMLEMECTNLTPKCVLETSGHVEKFTDMMVKDVVSGECFRADKLLEDFIDQLLEENPGMPAAEVEEHRLVQRQADAWSLDEIHALFQKYGIKSAEGNDLTKPFDFNLMFETRIGPEGTAVGYLRPETAQGLFVNFKRLLGYNGGNMPFSAAQIGLGFRNEIAPRGGLLRVREFCMAEIEHFVNPDDKSHPKFNDVKDLTMILFNEATQLGSGKPLVLTMGEALDQGVVNNQTLGYFMARTQMFMQKIGMDTSRVRFRQHLSTEMAHYASECWDCEIHTSYGWVECVGHADRACYDLEVHAKATNTGMLASQRLPEPKKMKFITAEPNRKVIGKTFKKDQKKVLAGLEELATGAESDLKAFQAKLAEEGSTTLVTCEGTFKIEKDMVSFKEEVKTVQEIKFLPSVIEPSFGIGRILYALLEHCYHKPDPDAPNVIMRFPAAVAPVKCNVYNLQSNAAFMPVVEKISAALTKAGISNKTDTSGQSVGKRYARADELGTPFGITVDYKTLVDEDVTLRERDSTKQIRVPMSEVTALVQNLSEAQDPQEEWEQAMEHYPVVGSGKDDAAQATVVEVTQRAKFSRPANLVAPKA
eukprot:CAMPEP_0185781330 /NCGR_PEP_ID=MMETSP1174-20130828/101986_1 /TAXON_ID=35687 /ORGANISM="Dictyocha speculum, Strain CCMP1381" /LENGTH=764 /DNA_ID=CAMNT_0028471259 /DNA_START=27 /DNA_END=2321 /DNA_ORIENTATION=-